MFGNYGMPFIQALNFKSIQPQFKLRCQFTPANKAIKEVLRTA